MGMSRQRVIWKQGPLAGISGKPHIQKLDAAGDRDRFMADVIETHLFELRRKGIFCAGSGHVSKGLH